MTSWPSSASGAFPDLDQLIRHQAVGLAMGLVGGLGIWCLDEAIDLPGRLVIPVAQVGHAVLRSDLDVAGMGLRDAFAGQAGDIRVGVQIEGHVGPPVQAWAGAMFLLDRNTLSGSQARFTSVKRARLGPYAASIRSLPSSSVRKFTY